MKIPTMDAESSPEKHSPERTVPLQEVAIRLDGGDNVAIAKTDLQPGTALDVAVAGGQSIRIPVRQPIPAGHKIALGQIPCGEPIRRYGHVIGFAAQAITPGQHVHTHNVEIKGLAREHAFGLDASVPDCIPEAERRRFLGFKRADGRVGTRNYIAIISTVNCSAHACREIALHFTPGRLAAFSNVDGVLPLAHPGGCGGSPDDLLLQRTLAGMALHPNVTGYVLVGLGCEWNLAADLVEQHGLGPSTDGSRIAWPRPLVIQDAGGLGKTVQAGIRAVEEMLPLANAVERTPQPVSELRLALECGGSDSWSGITANPVLGLVADQVVRQGGTVVLSETPEIYGAEHLLTRRAINPGVGQDLLAKLHWWEGYVQLVGTQFDNNPGPGNRAGGLTNIYEKALGAVAKSGTTPLMAVYDYAERVDVRGFVFMDTPGYDPVSVTGMVAGGCNLVVFTTGRGSVFGSKPAPTIKVCSNSTTYARMADDMDFDAGTVLQADLDMDAVAADLLDLVVDVASGQPSKSEAQNVGEAEFLPWAPFGVV